MYVFQVEISFTRVYPVTSKLNLQMHANHMISLRGQNTGHNPARALRALGLLLADGAPTVGGGKTF